MVRRSVRSSRRTCRQTTFRDFRHSLRAGATAYLPAEAGVDFEHVAVADGEIVELGNTIVRALATPGHAPAHDAYLVADRRRGTEEPWLVFTGDSLLVGDVGRPDLHAGGDLEPAARELYASIRRLLELPDHVLVYPSHYGGSVCGRGLSGNPFSSIGFERRHNSALAHLDAASFAEALLVDLPPAPADQAGDRRRESPRSRRDSDMSAATTRLGLRENAGQFALLVGLNAFVGAMVGLERSVLPLVGERDFDLASKSAILSFVVAFGIAKAFSNLAAGGLADRVGRKRLLVIGWLLALPVPLLIALAPSWGWIVAANLFLGVNQGLAWSMTVVMKIDLVGPRRRGLALGLNESAGYLGVAATALATGALAATYAPRTLVWVSGTVIALLGTIVSILFVRDTAGHVEREQLAHGGGVERNASVGVRPSHSSSPGTCAPARKRGSSTI